MQDVKVLASDLRRVWIMAALVGNMVVAIFGFSGAALGVMFVFLAIAFVYKAITGK